ncbi:hypothetical protein F5X99DRAFT_385366 [Biscogniauxia marginata]|nr:hypothetical protein F5X99DRAFT_385366 [Biscogniauxia marginata]
MAIQSSLSQDGIKVIITTSVFLLLAILSVIARFYCRFLQRKAISIDDHLIVASLVFTIATVGVGYALVLHGGVGLHMTDITEEQVMLSLKLFAPAQILWAIATCLVKISILFFYTSIFTIRRFKTAVFIVITLTIALLVVVILETFLVCRPFAFNWDKAIPDGVCGSSEHALLGVAIVNMVIDLSIVALPMPLLWELQMAFGKKMAISGILSLGLLICGLTAARIHSVLALDPLDFTHSVVPDIILGALEIELGVVNACLPILRPLIRKAFESHPAFSWEWSKKTGTTSASSKSRKGHMFMKNNMSFQLLPDNEYPLVEVVPGVRLNEAMARAHIDSFGESGSSIVPRMGDIVVQKDLYIYRMPIESSSKV